MFVGDVRLLPGDGDRDARDDAATDGLVAAPSSPGAAARVSPSSPGAAAPSSPLGSQTFERRFNAGDLCDDAGDSSGASSSSSATGSSGSHTFDRRMLFGDCCAID